MASSYERLSAVDESFFWIEHTNAPMHLASALIFSPGNLRRADGGIDAAAIKAQLVAHLHTVPRYRQKIAWIPVVHRPVWVDETDFDIDYHVRHASLPRPGNERQLKQLCAHIMEQLLDRQRPLWQLHIIEGLTGGRFALFAKVHHCMADGVSGIDLLTALLSPQPDTTPAPKPRDFVPRTNPGSIELFLDELNRRIGRPVRALRDIGAFVAHSIATPADAISRFRALRGLVEGMFPRPSPAPFNHLLSGQRRLEWLTMPLQSIEAIRGSLGGSVNDVVLAIVTGALRRFLSSRKLRVDAGTFRALTPVSTRGTDQHGTMGNRVSAWVVDLPVGEPDPREQLREIHRATRKIKDSKLPTGVAVVTEMSEWSSSTLLISMTARHLTRLLPCNLVVTNIPGPQFPVYLLGATLSEAFPFVPLADRLGLNIAVLSYNGKLCWGFHADYNLVPDLDAFVAGLRDAFGELSALVSFEPARKRRTHAVRAPN